MASNTEVDTTVKPGDVTVGMCFSNSWGYDQTNVDFYRVVEVSKSGKTGWLIPVAGVVDSDNGHSVQLRPGFNPPRFLPYVAEMAKRRDKDGAFRKTFKRSGYNGELYIPVEHGWCGEHAEGTAKHSTPVGQGH